MIRIGTSGFGYREWSPGFYPPEFCYEEYFSRYAAQFDFCEWRSTFYELKQPAYWVKFITESADDFLFTVKLHRRLTHARASDVVLARRFADTLRPLTEADRLGAVLAQFPFYFVNNPENRAYLCRLRAALDLPLVAELRNQSWFRPETLRFLKGWGVGLACLDAPPGTGIPGPAAVATSELGYVRFHGRNGSFWWKRDDPRRYEYRYRRRELLSWIPRLREIERSTKRVFVVFNNPRSAYAVANALSLRRLVHRSRAATRSVETESALTG